MIQFCEDWIALLLLFMCSIPANTHLRPVKMASCAFDLICTTSRWHPFNGVVSHSWKTMPYFYTQGYSEGFGPEITGSGEHAVTHYRYLLTVWLILLLCWGHFALFSNFKFCFILTSASEKDFQRFLIFFQQTRSLCGHLWAWTSPPDTILEYHSRRHRPRDDKSSHLTIMSSIQN